MPERLRRASPFGPWALGVVSLGAVVLSVAALGHLVSAYLVAGAFVVLVGAVAVGVTLPGLGIFARPVLGFETERRLVALTFDDGPDPRWTPAILDLLDAYGQRATFFVVGRRAQAHPDLVAEIVRRGHEVANHSWHHAPTTVFVPPKQLADELERTSRAVERACGARPRWFRPPVGLLSPRIGPAARLAHLTLVTWTASARDGVAWASPERAHARLRRFLVPGAILVLHDGAWAADPPPVAVEILGSLLTELRERGLRSVTLSELRAQAT